MKSVVLLCFAAMTVLASTLVKPASTIDVEGNVVEIVVKKGLLYAATDAGKLEIYDWKKRKLVQEYTYKTIHDFMGDPMKPKVFGVDVYPQTGRMITMVQDEGGERILYLYDNGKRTILLDKSNHLQMREARFVDNDHLLIATMSNELILIQIEDKKFLWRKKLSLSTFSDFQLNEDHSKVASTCESGKVYIVDVRSGKVLKTLEGGNKDNVFKVDFKNYKVLACGQDRKAVVYSLGYESPIVYPTKFLVYAGALNADASLSAFQINENNEIGIYDNRSKTQKYRLVGQQSVLNTIVFINNKELISSSDDNHIMIWRIP